MSPSGMETTARIQPQKMPRRTAQQKGEDDGGHLVHAAQHLPPSTAEMAAK
jgi:hypothetical protein